jgi:hypothetical protein
VQNTDVITKAVIIKIPFKGKKTLFHPKKSLNLFLPDVRQIRCRGADIDFQSHNSTVQQPAGSGFEAIHCPRANYSGSCGVLKA